MFVRRPRSRRGFTLVELMSAMAVLTIILGLCTALIVMLLRLSDSSQQHASDAVSLARAARLFRQDVRRANRVAAGSDRKHLTLDSGDGFAIEYAATRDELVRVSWWDDEILKTERLPLPAGSDPQFEANDKPDGNLAALLIERRAVRGSVDATPRVLRIEAVRGAALRFSSKGGVSQ